MTQEDFDEFVDNYDFLKINYSKSWQLMFQQDIYYNRLEFKNYLKFFLRFKETEPLESLNDYLVGQEDLAIQTIELEDWDQNFLTDIQLYTFLCTSIYTEPEEIIAAREWMQFVNYKLKFLNSKFNDNRLAVDNTHFYEFQQQLDIFIAEL